jgi:hypothetical protein
VINNLCSESGSKHDDGLRKKSEKAKSKEPFMKAKHIAAICDYCNSLIEGVRHKCTVCPGKKKAWIVLFCFKTEFLSHSYIDFDFCHTCYVIAKDSHYNHPFKTISSDDKKTASKKKRSSRESRKGNKAYPVHFGVHCDHCQVMIKGIRYKVRRIFLFCLYVTLTPL